jgi:hypothetical protein
MTHAKKNPDEPTGYSYRKAAVLAQLAAVLVQLTKMRPS